MKQTVNGNSAGIPEQCKETNGAWRPGGRKRAPPCENNTGILEHHKETNCTPNLEGRKKVSLCEKNTQEF